MKPEIVGNKAKPVFTVKIIADQNGGVRVEGFPVNRSQAIGIMIAGAGTVNQHFSMLEAQGGLDEKGNIKKGGIIKPTPLDISNLNNKIRN